MVGDEIVEHCQSLRCSVCSHTFSRLEHLHRHARTHTGERPFKCGCGRSFTRRDRLTRHLRLKHNSRRHRANSSLHSACSSHTQSPTQDIRSVGDSEPPQDQAAFIPQTPPSSLPNATRVEDPPLSEIGDCAVLDPVQDLTAFVDTMGLSSDWNMFAIPQIENNQEMTPLAIEGWPLPSMGAVSPELRHRQLPNAPQNAVSTPYSRGKNETIADDEGDPTAYTGLSDTLPQWNVMQCQYVFLLESIEQFRSVISDFELPSRHALTRYILGYFDGFHKHLPFIHLPTFNIVECAPELILAIAAIGAQYRFESHIGLTLFDAAKAVCTEQARRRTVKFSEKVVCSVANPLQPRPSDTLSEKSKWDRLQTVRALLLLLVFATWDDDPELLREAIGFQTILAGCLRAGTFTERTSSTGTSTTWHEWAKTEGDRRVELATFCYLTTHAIVYDIPPTILNDEIHLRLPCSSVQWNAKTAEEWSLARRSAEDCEPLFQDGLAALLTNPDQSPAPQTYIPSPLGNFVLIHALLQRLFMVQQIAGAAPSPCVDGLRSQMECALYRWKLGWQRAPESSLDPHNPSGPIPFTSTGCLSLAYVRLVCNLGPHRDLSSRDPTRIAVSLTKLPPVDRTLSLIPALLHSVHTLSIPVKLGVDFVAKSQHFFWSVQQFVCSLESAVFLSRWLYQIGHSKHRNPLRESEQRLLLWTNRIVAEAFPHSSTGEAAGPVGADLNPFKLGLNVLQIWTRIFKGNTSWRLVNILGESLEMLASMMSNGSIWTDVPGTRSEMSG
ncbi:fungal-specific transcription factor domain-containing protein [Aspergillus avenaceus]|uniref:Fungal-specific transcription factor domain-containing protein n=1 Tax=Aspergillus avenaceus TaxID=36643 RepID=A0A5N6U4Z3_ASPAV|nr:fungal-specific transcription factor domain-containing protein [Aspergillus avenaceus]